jgi:dipeptidyl aminopeptidase/acylaminoacyl peptidase
MDTDSPSKPSGGEEEYSFTPDGRSLIFTAKNAGRDEMWSTDINLWLAPVDGSSPPRPLTQNPAMDTQPRFSPDGKTLAYLAMKRAGYESDRYRIVVRAWPNGQDRVLTEAWDRSPATITWAPDGKEIWATAENLGQQSLFAVDAASGSVRSMIEKGTITAVCSLGDRMCVMRDTLTAPAELYSVRLAGDEWTPLTRFNQAKLDRVRMGEPGQFTFSGWNNEPVHGYVMKPVDF